MRECVCVLSPSVCVWSHTPNTDCHRHLFGLQMKEEACQDAWVITLVLRISFLHQDMRVLSMSLDTPAASIGQTLVQHYGRIDAAGATHLHILLSALRKQDAMIWEDLSFSTVPVVRRLVDRNI